MPAPASINALPGQSAIAKLLSGGGGKDSQSSDSTDLEQFAAHFQRLLGKQQPDPVDASALSPTALTAEQAGSDALPDDQLAALLPFIEALGLNQDNLEAERKQLLSDTGTSDEHIISITTIAPADTAALAAPVTSPASKIPDTPAITAANWPNASQQGLAHGQGAPMLAQAATNPPSAETAEATAGAPAQAVTPAKELSAGREFSSQLVAAITASKEERTPGSTAEAVHQVIAGNSSVPVKSNSIDPTIAQPVGSAEWGEEIGNRISWMAGRSESRAELVLTPPQMGRIEVNLSVKGDQATASFISANPVVREVLEAALPRLREVLADAGIQLGQAQVSAENAHQWAQQEKHGDNSGSDPTRGSTVDAAISSISSGNLSTAATLKAGRGLVDVFA